MNRGYCGVRTHVEEFFVAFLAGTHSDGASHVDDVDHVLVVLESRNLQ